MGSTASGQIGDQLTNANRATPSKRNPIFFQSIFLVTAIPLFINLYLLYPVKLL
jgi:hypothetical protein